MRGPSVDQAGHNGLRPTTDRVRSQSIGSRRTQPPGPGLPVSDSERPFTASGQRPTEIGPFSGAQAGTSRTRPIPAPWNDCAQCGWRHYPSTNGGAWHIVTACVSCGAPLQAEVDHTDERQEAPSGIEPADDHGEARS